ncbi:MAG: Y-family DNA polymerase [Candidatus Cloacimonadota bacterium]|nr:Y-family DNA polymerase [Candidatus Cloacimonadota bacterium]
MSRNKIFALVDCNSFYVACERVFRPDLRGKPVGVLSNNDGIVVAASPELKELNMGRGTPAFKMKKAIKKYDIHLFSSNYALYGDMSARVMKSLAYFTPNLEVYSIDEAFLELTGINCKNWLQYGRIIKAKVEGWTGIPVSVGIARTKTLAKLANTIAKKYEKFNGVFNLIDHPRFRKVLQSVSVDKIWGVGRRYAQKLQRYGIQNAWQLSQAEDNWIEKMMTIVGLRLVKELREISCVDIEMDIMPRKSIVSSKSFGKLVTSLPKLKEAVSQYTTRAVEKLRLQNSLAYQLMVFLQTNRFRQEPQYANYCSRRLEVPSAYTPDFIKLANSMLEAIYRPGYNYQKAGVMISDIIAMKYAPLDLFLPCYLDDERQPLIDSCDKINSKWGRDTIQFASSGIKRDWQMRRQYLSPRYTTCWSELARVK